ncbi:putative telomere length regulation protein elg1 [Phaeomoniella chlamydospora]|uniref:Putative telomere length regulation protein elg1 n=1 Tax=Phaeomoniella chlamydospora TaxID=158046 RepID=A0A0G2F0U1_PHACM|nr:putative telomere length regulation protein elg1 [Phaeomoniella chlamydospora]
MLPIWPPFSLGTKRIPKADHTRLSPRYSKESNKLKYIASSELERNSLLDRISSSLLGYHGQLRSENSIRVPVRKLVSGHKCLEGIDVVGNGGMVDRVGYVHPAIRKLRTTLLQSTPAFDRGEFETIAWINKYAPEKAEEVLQGGTEPVFLRDWIRSLSVSAVDDGSTKSRPRSQGLRKALRKKKRAKRAKDGLDEFIISSEDEDSELNEIEWSEDDRSSMSGTSLKRSAFRNIRLGSRQGSHDTPKNTILLSGPHGSGKTATVYAVAKELGFEIFEINAGSRRSAKDILDKVGDMTHNHLVQQCESNLDPNEVSSTIDEGSMQMEVSTGRQASMSAFLESKPRPVEAKKRCHPKQENHLEKRSSKTSQKQSLILIEEADILYDEDRSFWSTVTTLAAQSKRPIVITCTDEELVPFGDLTLEAILRFGSPPLEAATEYLSLLAACEGHLFDKARVQRLYQCKGHDLRATIMELNFWCQMGVGSNKGGLDWMVNKNEEVVTNRSDEKLRITSFGTFEEDMSFIPNQASVTSNVESGVEIEQDLMLFADEQLEVPAIDWVSRLEESMESDISSLSVDAALRLSQWASDLDVLYWSGDRNSRGQGLDMTQPDLSARARSSYCEGYPLLEAFESHSYSDNSAKMTAAIFTLLRPDITSRQICGTQSIMDRIAQSSTNAEIPIDRKFAETLSFLDTAHPVFPPPTGRLAPSLENCLATLITDVAPYVRYIMSYDDHLEQQREGLLDALSSQEGGTRGKGRTTRASRAALEGGRKDETRREKWFHVSPDHEAVVATAGNGWQEALLDELNQMNIQDTTEPEK